MTHLELHLVATVGGRGFGLQAEVFRFRAKWLEAGWPGDRRHVVAGDGLA